MSFKPHKPTPLKLFSISSSGIHRKFKIHIDSYFGHNLIFELYSSLYFSGLSPVALLKLFEIFSMRTIHTIKEHTHTHSLFNEGKLLIKL